MESILSNNNYNYNYNCNNIIRAPAAVPQEREGFVVGGTWKLESVLGKGSYGVVWSAKEVPGDANKKQQQRKSPKSAGGRVAVKVIDTSNFNETELQSVKREVVIHRRLAKGCENITQVYDVIEAEHRVYIVMELAKGGSLFDFLVGDGTRLGGLLEMQSSLLFWQMILALEHCHTNSVLHRDIKLENFLVNKDGTEVKLTDFGLCTTFQPNELLRSTCGSPLYIAPEVISGQLFDGIKVDIWALGITLHGMLLNRMPFIDNTGRLVFNKARAGLKNLPVWLSSAASDLLRSLLHPDPAKRISLEELKRHPWVARGKAQYEMRQLAKKESQERSLLRQSSSLLEKLSPRHLNISRKALIVPASPSEGTKENQDPSNTQTSKPKRQNWAKNLWERSSRHLQSLANGTEKRK